MNRHFLKLGLFFVVALAGLCWGSQARASAASWCGVLAPASQYSSPPSNSDCLNGQNYTALDNLQSLSGDQLKQAFINDINNYVADTRNPQHTGAHYIWTHIYTGGGITWDQRIMQSDVTAKIQTYSFNSNTAYDPASNSIISYPDSDARLSVVFYVGSTPYYAIKLDCGNPLDNLPGLPAATFDLDGFKVDNSWNPNPSGNTFFDDKVSVSGPSSTSTTTNPYTFSNLTAGNYTVSVAVNASGYTLVGWSLCSGTCTNSDFQANLKPGASFTWTFQAGKSYHLRWVYKKNGGPGGSLAATCPASGTSAAVTGTFSDPDGPTSAYIKVSGISYATATSSPYTWTVPAASATSVDLYVKDVGSAGTQQYVLVATKTVSCAATGTACPTMPNSQVTITLTNTAPNTGGPAAYGWGTYTEYDSQYRYDVNSVYDNSPSQWGGGSVPLTYTHASGSNTVTVDYGPYITDYPYDRNQAAVSYSSYYNVKYWSYSGSAVYNDYYTCNGWGWVNEGTATSPNWQWECTQGWTYHHDLVGYTPVQTGESDNLTTPGTAYGTTMQPCWARGFQVTSVNAGNLHYDSTVNPSNPSEHPTSVSSGGGAVNADFSYTNATPAWGLRQPMKVNLTYSAVYTWDQATGAETVYTNGCSPTTGSMTVMGGYSAGPGSGGLPGGGCSVSSPPLAAGDQMCLVYTVSPSGLTMNVDGGVVSSNFASMSSPKSCTGPLENLPYARFYGSDVLAGAQLYGSSCNPSAAISANRQGAAGSGTQYAAMSLGQISGFASAFLRGAATPSPPTGLSFANTTGGDGGNFGGPCTQLPDYFTADRPSSGVTNSSASSITDTGVHNGPDTQVYYDAAGNSTLSALNIDAGKNITIFVDGNLYINGDIQYKPGTWTWDGVNRTTNVPSLYVIVRGNIDIAAGVQHLDGVYIAQPDGAGTGHIRTCSAGLNSPYPAGSLFAQCNRPLTVTGAFIAQDVLMDRSYQSLRYGGAGENPWTGTQNAAEIYDFSPEVYLGNPSLNPTSGQNKNKYDYITSLSPVL